MLKSSAPIIIVIAIVFLVLEALKVGHPRFSFGWGGLAILATYFLLAQLIP